MTGSRIAAPFRLRKVLVVSDLSTASTNATWRAGLLARDHGAWLRILHVGRRASSARQAQAALDALAWELQERLKIAVLAQSVRGDLRKELAAAAGEADLLVVRTAQARPLRDWLTGFHPERLIHGCGTPTLVVRKPASVGYRRVLACVDGDGEAAAKVAAAAAMTRAPHQGVLSALVEEDARTPGMASTEAQLRGDRHRAAERLRNVVRDAMETGAAGTAAEAPSVVFDFCAGMLLAKERSILADLVVIGRRPCGVHAFWAPRTRSRAVLAGALADVLVLPVADAQPLVSSTASDVRVT
jgi:nucleotide-binding universal stress UspA family protein